jgi:uncharacterized SAM-binding protein YcdF (DUF218 family)
MSAAAGADAVVVLGAAVIAPGVAGPALLRRLDHGVTAFRARSARYLLLSGGIVAHPPAEAVVMRSLALARGVPEAALIVEDRARNTFENALYCGRIIREQDWRDIVVVTDGWHLGRALYVFRRLGLSVTGAGVPRPAGVSRRAWARLHLEDRIRYAFSAYLFSRGRHRPAVAAEWGIEVR